MTAAGDDAVDIITYTQASLAYLLLAGWIDRSHVSSIAYKTIVNLRDMHESRRNRKRKEQER